MKKKILLTGATGFVGSRLAARLVQENYQLHITARKSSNLWRLNEIQNKFHLHQIDLLESEKLAVLIQEVVPDIVFHCACYGGFPDEKNPELIIKTNFFATYHLLNICQSIPLEKFIYIGSSSEYGKHETAIHENLLERPASFYGIAKLAATQLVRFFGEEKIFPTLNLRIFSPYGAYDDPRRLIPTVINGCLLNQPLKLGSGQSVRDFIYIEDLVDAFLLALTCPAISGEIINLGSGTQSSVREVVNIILANCDYSQLPQWDAIVDRPNEPKNWVADITKAQQFLNWSPQTSLCAGLKKTITWTKKLITATFKEQSLNI